MPFLDDLLLAQNGVGDTIVSLAAGTYTFRAAPAGTPRRRSISGITRPATGGKYRGDIHFVFAAGAVVDHGGAITELFDTASARIWLHDMVSKNGQWEWHQPDTGVWYGSAQFDLGDWGASAISTKSATATLTGGSKTVVITGGTDRFASGDTYVPTGLGRGTADSSKGFLKAHGGGDYTGLTAAGWHFGIITQVVDATHATINQAPRGLAPGATASVTIQWGAFPGANIRGSRVHYFDDATRSQRNQFYGHDVPHCSTGFYAGKTKALHRCGVHVAPPESDTTLDPPDIDVVHNDVLASFLSSSDMHTEWGEDEGRYIIQDWNDAGAGGVHTNMLIENQWIHGNVVPFQLSTHQPPGTGITCTVRKSAIWKDGAPGKSNAILVTGAVNLTDSDNVTYGVAQSGPAPWQTWRAANPDSQASWESVLYSIGAGGPVVPSGTPPLPAGATWNLVFDDEFNDSAGSSGPINGLKTDKWNTGWQTGPTPGVGHVGVQGTVTDPVQGGEVEYYGPASVLLPGTDSVHLRLQAGVDGGGVHNGRTVESGMLSTAGLMVLNPLAASVPAGPLNVSGPFVLEVRMRIPGPTARAGNYWPVVWLTNAGNYSNGALFPDHAGDPYKEEIDVWEWLGQPSSAADGQHSKMNFHAASTYGGVISAPASLAGTDLSLVAHTYTFYCDGSTVQVWVDGIAVTGIAPSTAQVQAQWTYPQYLMLAFQALPGAPFPTALSGAQTDMRIDYVRVFVPSTTVPSPPTWGTLTPEAGGVFLRWTPGAAFGLPITGYTIVSTKVSDSSTITRSFSGPASTFDFTGLTNGSAYTFKITETTSAGTSAQSSASASETPTTGSPPPSAQDFIVGVIIAGTTGTAPPPPFWSEAMGFATGAIGVGADPPGWTDAGMKSDFDLLAQFGNIMRHDVSAPAYLATGGQTRYASEFGYGIRAQCGKFICCINDFKNAGSNGNWPSHALASNETTYAVGMITWLLSILPAGSALEVEYLNEWQSPQYWDAAGNANIDEFAFWYDAHWTAIKAAHPGVMMGPGAPYASDTNPRGTTISNVFGYPDITSGPGAHRRYSEYDAYRILFLNPNGELSSSSLKIGGATPKFDRLFMHNYVNGSNGPKDNGGVLGPWTGIGGALPTTLPVQVNYQQLRTLKYVYQLARSTGAPAANCQISSTEWGGNSCPYWKSGVAQVTGDVVCLTPGSPSGNVWVPAGSPQFWFATSPHTAAAGNKPGTPGAPWRAYSPSEGSWGGTQSLWEEDQYGFAVDQGQQIWMGEMTDADGINIGKGPERMTRDMCMFNHRDVHNGLKFGFRTYAGVDKGSVIQLGPGGKAKANANRPDART